MATEQQNTNGNGPESPSATLTLRMVMQGKEVGSIIGKKGDNIKKYREESGAKINISDGSCPERIVTVTGTTDQIFKAFDMICKKFEEDLQNTVGPNTNVPLPPITLRLIVPASQCGCLIGKGGSKIKEIREFTGAAIQVASEMLPNSTERAVTVSGKAEAITQCIYHVCCIMIESPPKGATIPYRPKPPMIIAGAGGQIFSLPGQYAAVPQPDITKLHQIQYGNQVLSLIPPQQTGLIPGQIPGMAATQLAFPQVRPQQVPAQNNNPQQASEMTIPNDLIGCIIGRGGQKINEIRQLSGATIKIANAEEGSSDRKVTITGTPETISLAQYLINTRITTEVSGLTAIGIR